MKAFQKLLLVCCCMLPFYIGIAQSQSINYKAIIRDDTGTILANDLVIIQFTILEGATNVYSENHTPTTDANGLVILNIGEGAVLSGDYTTIDWATTDHFLNVQINTGGGLVDMGTTQFLSVPYALHAQTAENTMGLEDIDEGNGIGWRLKDRDPDNYGNIGENAIDLSITTSPNTNRGATGNRAFAVGVSTIASGDTSFATGSATEASGAFSFAAGGATTASGTGSVVFGSTSDAIGDVSFAQGIGLRADALLSATFGRNNIGGGSVGLWTPSDPLFEIGNGSNNSSGRNNALTIYKNGNITMDNSVVSANGTTGELAVALGNETTSNGVYSLSAGSGTIASGQTSVAFGSTTTASGAASFTTGLSTTATQAGAVAMGAFTEASGSSSFAAGASTSATSTNATAFGSGTTASGFASFATGSLTSAGGARSFSFGLQSNAAGNHAMAGGDNNLANAENSVALGTNSQSFGDHSFSMGTSAIAFSNSEFVIGRYNDLYASSASGIAGTDRLFVVGNGTSVSDRDNAITVLKNGNTGIGTSNPLERLHVANGRLRIGTETVEDTGTNRLEWNCGLFPDTDDSFQLGGSALRWEAVWATDGTINTSDRREKKDIKGLNYGLREILDLNPVRFRWKAKPEQGEKLGLIAQDILKIIPEVVKTHEYVTTDEGEHTTLEKKELDRLGVYYTDLIPVLIKAIQEQQEIIQSYKSEQQQNKAAIADLQSQMNQLTALLQNKTYEK
ncbi:tail fiber domain-containing protein [uncultured Dokdonia sp.]|uniref:tail fiber domain-containing protein n=1 Tax=uncultured Dokdonia sp. TaxID=575653 RepID=UPI0026179380|nr:tail fiber domain-containing protein [uncultured Dokdonia sp.]